MEVKKITEGGMLSALMVIIGITMMLSGAGYWLYLDLAAPVMMALIHIRCGHRVGMMAAFSTLCITFLLFGNIVTLVYLIQALILGTICSLLIQSRQGLIENLIAASLLGCVLTLVLDKVIALLTGVSLLDDLPSLMMADFSAQAVEVIYYVSIASVPLVSTLIAYMGTLILGKYLHLLSPAQKVKYKQIRFYPALAQWIYYPSWLVAAAAAGILSADILAGRLKRGYVKALVICAAVILLYFILQDAMKLVSAYCYEKMGRSRLIALLAQWGMLLSLMMSFKTGAAVMVIAGLLIDSRTHMKAQKNKELQWYLTHHPKFSA